MSKNAKLAIVGVGAVLGVVESLDLAPSPQSSIRPAKRSGRIIVGLHELVEEARTRDQEEATADDRDPLEVVADVVLQLEAFTDLAGLRIDFMDPTALVVVREEPPVGREGQS